MCGIPQKKDYKMIIPRKKYLRQLVAAKGNGMVKIITIRDYIGYLQDAFLIEEDNSLKQELETLRNNGVEEDEDEEEEEEG